VTAAEKFWDRVADVYDGGIDYVFGNSMRQILLSELEKERDLCRTVEFGCGTGFFTPALATRSKCVVATDFSEQMVALTREKMKGIPNVSVRKENCEKTTFASGAFDCAFLGLTLNMVDGPTTISEMHRILKPGGRLLVTVPTNEGTGIGGLLGVILRNMKVFGRVRQPGTVLYTQKALHNLVEKGGFSVQSMEMLTDREHSGGFHGIYMRALKR
jgi:ubiquinone/menaquinone biosynthesis C-methylase UbiE